MLEIKSLHVKLQEEDKVILRGVDLKIGAGFGRSTDITVTGNDFHDIRTDGLTLGSVARVLVEDNTFRDFHPLDGDHPDMIQVWNQGGVMDLEDITTQANTFDRGSGGNVQTLFIQGVPPGETGFPFVAHDITIADNVISGGSNDPDNPALNENLERIRERANRAIWILPAVPNAREQVESGLAGRAFELVRQVTGGCGKQGIAADQACLPGAPQVTLKQAFGEKIGERGLFERRQIAVDGIA